MQSNNREYIPVLYYVYAGQKYIHTFICLIHNITILYTTFQ